jgi:hypothetical protein
MSALDTIADKAQAASERFAKEGGIKAKLADELAEDAAFLRKLKPELIRKRLKGQAPTDQKPGEARRAPSGPQLGDHPTAVTTPKKSKQKSGGSGPNPFVVIGAALALGIVAAKVIDWRGHAHPRY